MESINFNTGLKTFCINGDENRTITFNPTDANLVIRLQNTIDKLDALTTKMDHKDTEDLKGLTDYLKDMELEIKEIFNYLFDSDVYDALFNGASPLTMINGIPLFEIVFKAITPILEKELSEEERKASKRIAKYQKSYK